MKMGSYLTTNGTLPHPQGKDYQGLPKDYLNMCQFVGVSNTGFKESSGTTSTEKGKRYAIRHFVKAMVDMSHEVERRMGKRIDGISFGMSDDDRKNVEAVNSTSSS